MTLRKTIIRAGTAELRLRSQSSAMVGIGSDCMHWRMAEFSQNHVAKGSSSLVLPCVTLALESRFRGSAWQGFRSALGPCVPSSHCHSSALFYEFLKDLGYLLILILIL